MGMLEAEIIRFLKIAKTNGIKEKSLVMIGKQDININFCIFLKTLKNIGIEYDEAIAASIMQAERIDAFDFFKMFGFKKVSAVDFSEFEGADIVFDLNSDLPEELNESFDYIINGGTLEHVFDIKKAIINMSRMLKCGGIIMHISPAVGWVNHGFYSMSPTFFQDFYSANGYAIESLEFECLISGNEVPKRTFFSEDLRVFHSVKDINDYVRLLQQVKEVQEIILLTTARRIEKTAEFTNPIQGFYQKIFDNNNKVLLNNIKFRGWATDIAGSNSKIALYGCGNVCDCLLDELFRISAENRISVIFDGDVRKAGTSKRGIQIEYPNAQKLAEYECIYICSADFEDEILSDLLKLGVKNTQVRKTSEFA